MPRVNKKSARIQENARAKLRKSLAREAKKQEKQRQQADKGFSEDNGNDKGKSKSSRRTPVDPMASRKVAYQRPCEETQKPTRTQRRQVRRDNKTGEFAPAAPVPAPSASVPAPAAPAPPVAPEKSNNAGDVSARGSAAGPSDLSARQADALRRFEQQLPPFLWRGPVRHYLFGESDDEDPEAEEDSNDEMTMIFGGSASAGDNVVPTISAADEAAIIREYEAELEAMSDDAYDEEMRKLEEMDMMMENNNHMFDGDYTADEYYW